MKSRPIKLVNKTQTIKISQKSPRIIIRQVGGRGGPGEQGLRGYGIPDGGVDGQFLTKDTDTPFQYRWETPILADKNFVVDFTTLSVVPVNHNLNKYPSVTVIDSAGDQVEGEVYHMNTSQLVVRFASAFSGRVTCN